MKEKDEVLKLPVFAGMNPEASNMLLKSGKILEYPKGKILMRAKEPVDSIYFQLSGKSMIYNLTHHGKRKILFIYGKGALLNENIFNNYNASIYCETLEKSCILAVPVSEFTKMMQADFTLVYNVIEMQERKIWRLGHQLKNTMSSIYLERKLAAKLWKLSRDFGIDTDQGRAIDVNMTITFLADMLGVTRETASRVTSTLTELGLMKMSKKRIIIEDTNKLSHFYRTGKID